MANYDDLGGGGKKRSRSVSVRFAIFAALVAGVVFLPVTLIFFVCMIPTMVAGIVDQYPIKTAWLTIGAMNMAGTVPVLCKLLDAGRTLPAASQLIFNPNMLLIAYSGALVGWLIYNKVTPLVAIVVQNRNKRRLEDITKRQEELVRKWGEKVVS